MDENEQQDGQAHLHIVNLDGSIGTGVLSHLTIITTDKAGGPNKEEVYEIPEVLINYKSLRRLHAMNLILGFKVEKTPTNTGGAS